MVPLELDIEGPPLFLSVDAFPGMPVRYSVQLADNSFIRLTVEPAPSGRQRVTVEFFEYFSDRRPVRQLTLTATGADQTTRQLPVRRQSSSSFVSDADLAPGPTQIAVIGRTARRHPPLRRPTTSTSPLAGRGLRTHVDFVLTRTSCRPTFRPSWHRAGNEQECEQSAGVRGGVDPGGLFGHLFPRRASGETGLIRSFNDPVRAGTVVRGVGAMSSLHGWSRDRSRAPFVSATARKPPRRRAASGRSTRAGRVSRSRVLAVFVAMLLMAATLAVRLAPPSARDLRRHAVLGTAGRRHQPRPEHRRDDDRRRRARGDRHR